MVTCSRSVLLNRCGLRASHDSLRTEIPDLLLKAKFSKWRYELQVIKHW